MLWKWLVDDEELLIGQSKTTIPRAVPVRTDLATEDSKETSLSGKLLLIGGVDSILANGCSLSAPRGTTKEDKENGSLTRDLWALDWRETKSIKEGGEGGEDKRDQTEPEAWEREEGLL